MSNLICNAQSEQNLALPDSTFLHNVSHPRLIPIQSMGTTTEFSTTLANGDNAPFWLTNNKYGLGSVKDNSQYIRTLGWIDWDGDWINKNIKKISVLADLVVARNLNSTFHLQQLYIDADYRSIRLSVGAKQKSSLFKNKELSSGGMTLSANARPIPQIELSIPDFVTVPYSQNKLQIIGGTSYGWFTDNKFKLKNSADGYYAKDVLYHRKYGFIKYENKKNWNLILGLEMDTQWGGRFYKEGEYWGNSPAKFFDFFRVLIPMHGGDDSNVTDKVNIAGNVYGSTHFIFNYKLKEYNIKAYHEHFFEDHSGLFFKNIPDGLYGLELNLNKGLVSNILFEYLHSKDQSGPFLWDKNENISTQISGGDNYYNHMDYVSLSNYGFTTGNPLFTSPIYNKGNTLMIANTRLTAFHGGINGYLSNCVKYKLLGTYSKSWGTPFYPSTTIRKQMSLLSEAIYIPRKLKGWNFSGALAYDHSTMIGNNFGIQIKLSKTFTLE